MVQAGIQVSSLKAFLQTGEDVRKTFLRLGEMGCRIVQLQWIAPSVPAETVAEALKEAGLKSVSVQDYYEEVTANREYYLQLNRLCGSNRVCVSGIPAEYRSYEGCIAFSRELDRLGEELEKEGMVLSFHPRKQEFDLFGGVPAAEILMEHTRKELCLSLDLYHVCKAGQDGAAWIRRYGSRIDLVHFKDFVRLADGSEKLVPVGQGDIAWEPMVRACLEENIPWAFAEQESWDRDPFICMKESFSWLINQGFCSR